MFFVFFYTLEEASVLIGRGFKNLKLKIGPQADLPFIRALRERYPDLPLMVDANAAYRYSQDTVGLFSQMDELGLFVIEQPLIWNDLCDHAKLQRELNTPLALDESVDGTHAFEQAIELHSARLLNIKISRVGGFTEAIRLYRMATENGFGVWLGGMLAGPIGFAAVTAFSALESLTYPADYISSHYLIRDFEAYFKEKPYEIADGFLTPRFKNAGLGFAIDHDALSARIAGQARIVDP